MTEIYLDETGDNGLNFEEGKSEPWFLIAGIIIDSKDRNVLIEQLDTLAGKYFGGGQIKSKNLSDPAKRKGFFEDLPREKWRGVLFQVNKPLLHYDSFKWKPTFLKRVPRQLYNYLITAIEHIMIYPDPTGDSTFQKSLVEYFVAQSPLTLFDETKIQFSRSKECRINQLADICSGTRFRDFRDKTNIFEIIQHKFSIRTWPITYRDLSQDDVIITSDIDEQIIYASVNFAKMFIERYESSSDHLKKDQIYLANILLDEVVNGNPFYYIQSKYLKDELSAKRGSTIGEYYLRTKVIGLLRTNDVLIVSNRKGGYKLPVNYSEVEEYFKNMAVKVEPMQNRAEAVSNHMFTIMGKKLFDDPRWNCLRKYK